MSKVVLRNGCSLFNDLSYFASLFFDSSFLSKKSLKKDSVRRSLRRESVRRFKRHTKEGFFAV